MKKAIALCMAILLLMCTPVWGSAENTRIAQLEELLISTLDGVLDQYRLECNETGIVLIAWYEGVSVSLQAYMLGIYMDNGIYSIWENACKNTEGFVCSLRDLIDACGFEDLDLLYIEIDEYTHTVPFFIMHNKDVVYNCIPKPL